MGATAQDLETTVAELLRETSAPDPYPAAHRRVIDEAMALMAERGYAAASLRELARRLSMRQPSLYHYFASKEELVEQIIRAHAHWALRVADDLPPHPSLEEGLRYALGRMIDNYRAERHVTFMRFLVAIGPQMPAARQLAYELLQQRGHELLERFVDHYVTRGDVLASDRQPLVELVANALSMRLVGRAVLFRQADLPDDDEAFADFVVDTAVRGVRARATAS